MIDLLIDADAGGVEAGDEEPFEPPQRVAEAVRAALAAAGFGVAEPDLCVRFASDAAVHELNRQWRGKDRVTDVLSFPMQEPPVDPAQPLGDIALAVPFVRAEAARLGLPFDAHLLHLVVHATLHLIGYDHADDDEAARMQALERCAMRRLGLHEPYPDEADDEASHLRPAAPGSTPDSITEQS
jgi:probable rRNA maturation factor